MPKLEGLETEIVATPDEGYAILYYAEVDGAVKLMAKLPDGSSVEVLG